MGVLNPGFIWMAGNTRGKGPKGGGKLELKDARMDNAQTRDAFQIEWATRIYNFEGFEPKLNFNSQIGIWLDGGQLITRTSSNNMWCEGAPRVEHLYIEK